MLVGDDVHVRILENGKPTFEARITAGGSVGALIDRKAGGVDLLAPVEIGGLRLQWSLSGPAPFFASQAGDVLQDPTPVVVVHPVSRADYCSVEVYAKQTQGVPFASLTRYHITEGRLVIDRYIKLSEQGSTGPIQFASPVPLSGTLLPSIMPADPKSQTLEERGQAVAFNSDVTGGVVISVIFGRKTLTGTNTNPDLEIERTNSGALNIIPSLKLSSIAASTLIYQRLLLIPSHEPSAQQIDQAKSIANSLRSFDLFAPDRIASLAAESYIARVDANLGALLASSVSGTKALKLAPLVDDASSFKIEQP